MAVGINFNTYLSNQQILETDWIGEVVDNKDPEFSGRCRVRVFGLFDGRENLEDSSSNFTIPDDHLPWAYPAGGNVFAGGKSKGSGHLSVPKIGSRVKIRFSGGNIYSPEYVSVQDLNESVIEEVKNSYENSHVLFFDEDENVKVVYTPAKGIEIFHKDSHILINPDSSITIEHKESSSLIELVGSRINVTANSTINLTSNSRISSESNECILNGSSSTKLGPTPVYSGVLAEPLWVFLKMMASAIDAKSPSTPGVLSSQAASFQQLSTSKNVKLSK